jgi:hypothetical protein
MNKGEEIIELDVEDVGKPIEVNGDIERARRMCVYDAKSYTEVAEKLGVSAISVRKWAKDGGWNLERRIVTSGQEAAVCEAMEKFALSRELPLANGYYELQELALAKLKDVVKDGKATVHDVNLALDIASKGLGLGERILNRTNPKRAKELVGADGATDGRGIQVNILGAVVKAKEAQEIDES